MADGRHFGKKFYRHISAVVWPLLMKFGMVTHIGIQGIDSKNSEFVRNRLPDLDKIWPGDTDVDFLNRK